MKTPFNQALIACIVSLFIYQHTFAQQQKYALIIGVKDYVYVPPLKNTLNDAQDMAAVLRRTGFDVQTLYNPKTKREMMDAIRIYMKKLEGNTQATGLVFYSGHGLQVKGINYFLPTTANLQIEADLDEHALKMEYLLGAVEQSGNALNIFILDACRNSPFRGFSRSTDTGLSQVNAPKGSYVVYATAPGSVASDGTGRNGLFTSKLLKYINEPNIPLEQVFKYVARDVQQESQGSQIPWINYSYFGDFYFSGTSNTPSTTQPITQPIVKTEPAYVAPVTTAPAYGTTDDYGYGSSDAPTVTVGTQEWLGKNLNVDRFANGDPIPEAKTDDEWKRAGENKQPAWCYYNNDPANGRTYGRLYNWYAVTDPRGLAPKGWHAPSDSEWDIIIKHLAPNGAIVNKPEKTGNFTYSTTEGVGALLKSTSGWYENGNGNNRSGIAGLPGGNRHANGTFSSLGKDGFWWSSSESSTYVAWYRYLGYNLGNALRHNVNKGCGFSVRCVRD